VKHFKIGDLVRHGDWGVGLVVRFTVVDRLYDILNEDGYGYADSEWFQMNAMIVLWADNGVEDEFIENELILLEKINESR